VFGCHKLRVNEDESKAKEFNARADSSQENQDDISPVLFNVLQADSHLTFYDPGRIQTSSF
jgi:hypothetical protein